MKTRLLIIGIIVLSKLPIRLAHALASFIGILCYHWPNVLKHRVTCNISRCFVDASKRQQQQLIRQSLQHTFKMALEMPRFWCQPQSKVLSLVKQIHGEDTVLQAFQQGKGIILLGPHLGAWELAILYLSNKFPMYAMYKPQKNPKIDDFVLASRRRLGTTMVPTSSTGIRTLYKALRAGKAIGILPDHDPGDKGGGLFVPFFGIQARTMSLVAQLAQKTNAPVFFGFMKRLPYGQGFDGHYLQADPRIYHPDLHTALSSMNADIEKLVSLAPEQYEWAVKRFRKRPPGEPDFYAKRT